MGKAKKSFAVGQTVEVQRDVGKPWEIAKYLRKLWASPGENPYLEAGVAGHEMKGWHRVELDPASPPRHIDTRSGMELHEPNEHTRELRTLLVPSQRLRIAHAWHPVDGHAACLVCGVVKRADGMNRACTGKAPIVPTRQNASGPGKSPIVAATSTPGNAIAETSGPESDSAQSVVTTEEDHCPQRADSMHCMHWWDGEACCACDAPAMTAEQRAAQGMDP